ncbi:xanthine dehydrogenase family protein subunit M [Eubacteriaceae bacterium ES2]|nr:xanthine dehydrogenase family protein subunit M [Eubacteriaceae bacterium ES2]
MKFESYFEPSTVDECIQILAEQKSDVKLLAGGTDLVIRMRSRVLKPKAVVSLNAIPELSEVTVKEDGLYIGAMARLMDVSKSELLTGAWKIIKTGAGNVSSMQVRNIATIGGNTCNASPSADTVPGLVVSGAMANIVGKNGSRSVLLEDFFTGPGKTVLAEDEMLVGFIVPKYADKTGAVYKKYSIRGDTDIAIIGVAGKVTLNEQGAVADVKIALGGVAPTVMRVPAAEDLLKGKMLTDQLIEEAAVVASEACKPITDARATKEYRKEMVMVWVQHVLKDALQEAQNN